MSKESEEFIFQDLKAAPIYFRKKENWFKELLIKLKILKPKYLRADGIISLEENLHE